MSAGPSGFGRYRVLGSIGSGATGTVYQAHDPLIDRMVAVKMIRTEMLADEQKAEYLSRFRTEAQAGGRCIHPAIVAIFDAGEADGAPYLVMEYVEGRSLAQLLDDAPAATPEAMPLMRDLLAALGYAHRRGVIHRDIKPANIMVTPEGRVKIADFGIARLDRGNLTQLGDMLGTPSYMAPEQLRGEAVDHRADLFSAAAVLHRLLAGRAPFAGKTMTDTLLRLTDPAEADLSALEAGPHGRLAAPLRRALSKDPEQRYASAAEFAAALEAAAGAPADDRTMILPGPALASSLPAGLIEQAEALLTQETGPMARLHVARAARETQNAAAFLARLAAHIPDPKRAAAFLRATGAPGVPAAHTQQMTQEAAAGRGISPAMLDAVRAALAPYTGPIARVLVAQAVREAANLDGLVEKLAGNIPKEADAARFRREVKRILEK